MFYKTFIIIWDNTFLMFSGPSSDPSWDLDWEKGHGINEYTKVPNKS